MLLAQNPRRTFVPSKYLLAFLTERHPSPPLGQITITYFIFKKI